MDSAGAFEEAAAQAELVVFCTPVDRIAEQMLAVAPHCRPGTLLTDVGSTKAAIVREVQGKLPSGVAFVGSHPLAGSEKNGPDHADAELFQDRLVVLTPAGGDALAPKRIAGFWEALGAQVRVMEAEEHDRALALTSHLPHLLAATLASTVPVELHALTATGFRDMTRLAAGNPEVWAAICHTNRAFLLDALTPFHERLASFQRALETGDQVALVRLLTEAKVKRDALIV